MRPARNRPQPHIAPKRTRNRVDVFASTRPRRLGRMTDIACKPGDDVFTPRAPATVVDVRATPSGKWVFGVEDTNGAVDYYTARALRSASS